MDDLEKRIREVENQLSFYRGGTVVGAALILAILGYNSFIEIPTAVETAINDKVGSEVMGKIRAYQREYSSLAASKEEAARKLNCVRYGESISFTMPFHENKLLSLSPPKEIRLNTKEMGPDETFIISRQ